MVTTDLGACEWFIWDLRRSNLIDRSQLDQIVGEFLSQYPGAEPPSLAEHLVRGGVLTEFQAERLLQGKTQGFVLGPFTLSDVLGVGSMGTVYKSTSKTDDGWYAVKVLPRRSMWNVRIARRKVRDFEKCQHPTVVPFVDVGTTGAMHYLAWPLVEGVTLERLVQEHGPLSVEQTVNYASQTMQGLQACHQHGLFHGLLKPSNLMITPEGDVRILDLGIGCLLAETEGESLVDTMSSANTVNSGLDCASPESILDPTNLTPIGDQYSLGCTMYFCLTGRYPFPEGTAVEKMMCHQTKQPTPVRELNPKVPDNVLALVEKLMAKAPEARFASTPQVLAELESLGAGLGAAPARNSRFVPTIRPAADPGARTPLPPVDRAPAPVAAIPMATAVAPAANHHPGSLDPRQAFVPPAHANSVPNYAGHSDPGPYPGSSPNFDRRQQASIGPVVMALIAVLAGTAAWFVSSFLFAK